MSGKIIRLGTRGSALALQQTARVAGALKTAHPEIEVETITITTSGDWKPEHGETRLSETAGGKGQFAKEIQQALLEGSIDAGVHSIKDLDSHLPDNLQLPVIVEREDVRDAFISVKYDSIDALPEGAIVGTASVRRRAFLLAMRPDLNVVPIRGNVPTRLQKLQDGMVDATFLAVAGLERLGMAEHITMKIGEDAFLPCAGQGAIGLEILRGNEEIHRLLTPIHDVRVGRCVFTERAALRTLDGSCHTPIGCLATYVEDQSIRLRLCLSSLEGDRMYRVDQVKEITSDDEACSFGIQVAEELLSRLPEGFEF